MITRADLCRFAAELHDAVANPPEPVIEIGAIAPARRAVCIYYRGRCISARPMCVNWKKGECRAEGRLGEG